MFQEDLSRNFGFLLNDVARLMRLVYDRRVKDLGLTRAQWWVLTHLFRSNGVSQTELAEMLEVEKPTLGRLIDRLKQRAGFAANPMSAIVVSGVCFSRLMRSLRCAVCGKSPQGFAGMPWQV